MNSPDQNIDDVLLAPLFIVGTPRSGTTWLQRMLLAHPGVIGGQESNFFLYFNWAIESVLPPPEENARRTGLSNYWSEEEFYEEIRALWIKTFAPLAKGRDETRLLVEKSPMHGMRIARIKKVLPRARFLHVVRDSRSVVASLLAAGRSWGADWAPKNAREAAIQWWSVVNTCRTEGATLGSDAFCEVNYESVRADTVQELRRIFEFSGLPHDEALIQDIVAEHRFERQKQSTDAAFVNTQGESIFEPEGFYRKGTTDSWRRDLSALEKLVVWRFTRRLMRECGYTWKGYAGHREQ